MQLACADLQVKQGQLWQCRTSAWQRVARGMLPGRLWGSKEHLHCKCTDLSDGFLELGSHNGIFVNFAKHHQRSQFRLKHARCRSLHATPDISIALAATEATTLQPQTTTPSPRGSCQHC